MVPPGLHFEHLWGIQIIFFSNTSGVTSTRRQYVYARGEQGRREEDERKTSGGQEEDKRRTREGREEDEKRTRGGRGEDDWRIRGGREEDKNDNGREEYDGENSWQIR